MSQLQSAGLIWRDKFRELLFPLMILGIVGTLWVVGYAEDRQEIADRPLPPLSLPANFGSHATSVSGNGQGSSTATADQSQG